MLFVFLVGPGILFVPVWAKAARRFGKQRGYYLASAVFISGALLLLGYRTLPIPLVAGFVAICGAGYAGRQMFPLSMLPDTIAADAEARGTRQAGAFTGYGTAGETAGFAVGPALVLPVLAFTGFVASIANVDVTQPASAILGVLLAFTIVPATLTALSLLLLRRCNSPELAAIHPDSNQTPIVIMPITAHSAFVTGTYCFGLERVMLAVAPVAAAASDAAVRGVPVHFDACIGGWILPFMDDLGFDVPTFDFRVPGVRSISVDLHKYAYAPKGASLLPFSDHDYQLNAFFAYSDWPGYPVVHTTMQSTKSAGPMAAAWAVCRRIGCDGCLALVASAREATGSEP